MTSLRVPTARIVGVYSVGGAGSGVLVMENVWYPPPAPSPPGPEQAPEQTQLRFDLKGASRQRLASPDNNQVMFDENLLRRALHDSYIERDIS